MWEFIVFSAYFYSMDVKDLLEAKVEEYNQVTFIENDPISIPHAFITKQDREIAGLFAAILAWGQRKTILNKCKLLLSWMDHAPYDFIRNHTEDDLEPFTTFRHRTFNGTDALFFIHFLREYYKRHDSLEEAFLPEKDELHVGGGLARFHNTVFAFDHPVRCRKHIATPERNSACKRINMFLRWMVRNDPSGVDFGIWHQLKPSQLIAPCDVHVDRVARKLGLIERKQTDWKTALELTDNLRKFDPDDPVRFDFALFGLGIEEKF